MNGFDCWENELYHHGIKGQKWGVRRYQNSDGTLTDAGRTRYLSSDGSLTRKGQKQYQKELKKLRKYQANADLATQARNAEKYGRRAKIAGGIGLGLAGGVVGSQLLKGEYERRAGANDRRYEALNGKFVENIEKTLNSLNRSFESGKISRKDYEFQARQLERSAYGFNTLSGKTHPGYVNLRNQYAKAAGEKEAAVRDKFNAAGQIATVAAAASLGFAAYNAVKAHAAKTRMTEAGHAKAVAKARAQADKIRNMFGDVPLSDLSSGGKKKR